jgi:hypothetical protein
MATKSQLASTLLPLSDAELIAVRQDQLDQLELTLSDTPFEGLLLRAPAQVDVNSASSLPMIVATQKSVLRGWEVVQSKNLTVFLTDIDSGRTQAATPLEDPKDLEPNAPIDAPRPPRPSGSAARGTSTAVWRFDARELFDMAWRPGRYALAAVSWDWASNTQQVRLAGSGGEAASRPTRVEPAAAAGSGLPSYRPFKGGPQAPQQGLVFDLRPSPDGRHQIAAGAFTIKARDAHLGMPSDQSVAQGIAALVPITVAVLSLDAPQPWLYSWAVPVYGRAPATPGDSLTGYFAIDLATSAFGRLPAGSYVAYLMAEGSLLGPRRVQL